MFMFYDLSFFLCLYWNLRDIKLTSLTLFSDYIFSELVCIFALFFLLVLVFVSNSNLFWLCFLSLFRRLLSFVKIGSWPFFNDPPRNKLFRVCLCVTYYYHLYFIFHPFFILFMFKCNWNLCKLWICSFFWYTLFIYLFTHFF